MYSKICLSFFLSVLFSIGYVNADLKVTGKIVDTDTGQGLEGVEIRINNQSVVYFTDSAGKFDFNPKNATLTDSVCLKLMGYKPVGRVLAELRNAEIMLTPLSFQLKEITFEKRKPRTKILNGFNLRHYAERQRIPDLEERQTDMIGRPFLNNGINKRFSTVRSVTLMQESFCTNDMSLYKSQQRWRIRLRIFEAGPAGQPTENELLKDRIILTEADMVYKDFDRIRFDPNTNSTAYTNYDYSRKLIFGMLEVDLRKFEIPFTSNGIFVFVELLPPVLQGGTKLFRIAKMDVGNSGWFLNGRSGQWSRGVHFILQPDGKTVTENIEPAIALQLMD